MEPRITVNINVHVSRQPRLQLSSVVDIPSDPSASTGDVTWFEVPTTAADTAVLPPAVEVLEYYLPSDVVSFQAPEST